MPTLNQLDAVILAGGLGTRLRSVVADRPKPLASVAGRPFLTFILDQFVAAGLRRVTLCVGYLGEMVEAELGKQYGPLELCYSHENQPLGTAGAVRSALPLLKSSTILVANGDSYCESDLDAFLQFHRDHNAVVSLLLTHVSDTSRFGQVVCDDNGRVRQFTEKQSGSGAGWINAGIYLMERNVLEAWSEGTALSFERDVFPSLLPRSADATSERDDGSSAGLWGFTGGGKFLDIGTPESYAEAEAFLRQCAPAAIAIQ